MGNFGFDRTLFDKAKDKWWWMELTESNTHQSSELVAYHKVKCIFLNLADIDKEDPNQLIICEFEGQYAHP